METYVKLIKELLERMENTKENEIIAKRIYLFVKTILG